MIGTEHEVLAHAVSDCATAGRDWIITDSKRNTIWTIECDTKVDEDDLVWPVIVHMRGALGSDQMAVLVEAAAQREP